MRLNKPDMMAAWAVALALVMLVAGAPWDKLQSRVPLGVVDVAQQRFAVEALDSAQSGRGEILHRDEPRFTPYGPEGL